MRYINSNMNKCLITKDLTRNAMFFLFCLFSFKGVCQSGESTVSTLVKMGFENVGFTEYDK